MRRRRARVRRNCAGIGNSNHLFPDGQRYRHPERKSSAANRALYGEDSPLSMRIYPLKRAELPPFDVTGVKKLIQLEWEKIPIF